MRSCSLIGACCGASAWRSSSSSSTSSSASSSSGTGGQGGSGGGGGAGGGTGGSGGGGWPTCDSPPVGVPVKTLNEIWKDNPAQPTAAWIPGVYVTAISKAG